MHAGEIVVSRDDDSKQKYDSKKNLKFCGKLSVKLSKKTFILSYKSSPSVIPFPNIHHHPPS